MRRIITFLGIFAKETTYSFENNIYQGEVFPKALREFCDYDSMLVCVTSGAKEKSFPVLEELNDSKIEAVDIPNNQTTEEMWQTFKIITEKVDENDSVIFDITHGLRSLPFLVFLFAAYLKAAKNVKIEAIYYGALELSPLNNGVAPVINLSEFISIIDWITATDQFIQTGNGQFLANLLFNGNAASQELAFGVNGISQGLQLLRPMDVLEKSALLPELIEKAAPTVSQSELPFITLLGRVEKDYCKFGLRNPIDYTISPQSCLLRQLQMVEWYIEKGQIVQALSIAREWLPSLLCYHFHLNPLDKTSRDEMELLLNGGKIKDKEGNTIRKSDYLESWYNISKQKRKRLNKLWGGDLNLANLRNDVLHAGFRKNPKNAEDIIKQTKQVVEELVKIAQDWNLQEDYQ